MKDKQYLVVFAGGTPQEVCYPVKETTKAKAALEFTRMYLGRVDQVLARLVKVVQVDSEEEE